MSGLCAVLLAFLACNDGAGPRMLDLPDRPSGVPGGAGIAREIRGLELEAREERIYREISSGNVPSWLRRLERVDMTVEDGDGEERRVTFWVTPDYLAVGSDTDFFLVPLSPQTGQRIADLVGGSLPTSRMVDAVWESARVRLSPIRFEPDEFMTSVRYFRRHDRLIQGQRKVYGVPAGIFAAGHKVDVVLSALLSTNPGKVALYGWHLPDGEPIQPLTAAAPETRVAFSHGIRIVDREILVDGMRHDLSEVLRDPGLADLVSDEGVIPEARYSTTRQARAVPEGALR